MPLLTLAAVRGYSTAELLLLHGADPNTKVYLNEGDTFLHMIVKQIDPCLPGAAGGESLTLLQWQEAWIALFLKFGADENIKNVCAVQWPHCLIIMKCFKNLLLFMLNYDIHRMLVSLLLNSQRHSETTS